ncbi:hypothetical protein GGR51DRAFT_574260 [Nemania sp. FL0031]|nr:hypothetical protein GGR51DRAFT_574260 [Nemania sp. FL0031]
MARQPSVRLLACAILATASALVTASDDCYEETSPNLFTNPSWEDGLTGWNYIYPHTISTAQHSDGDYSLMTTSQYSYQLVTQTVNDLVVGTAYEFSVDFNIIVSNVGLVESCTMYLYHDVLSSTNLVAVKAGAYNLNSNKDWKTLTGTYTATATSALLGFYTVCSPYRIPQIAIYLDNAVLRGPATQVCPTTSEPTVAPTTSESTPVSTSEPTPTPSGSSSSAPPSSFSASPSSSPTPTPSSEPSSVPPSSYSVAPSSSYSASPSSSYSVSPSSYSASGFPASSTPANSYPVPPSSTPTSTPSSVPASSYPIPPSSYPAPSSPVSSTPPSGSSSIPVGSYPVPPSSYPVSSHPAPSNTPSATPSSGPSLPYSFKHAFYHTFVYASNFSFISTNDLIPIISLELLLLKHPLPNPYQEAVYEQEAPTSNAAK